MDTILVKGLIGIFALSLIIIMYEIYIDTTFQGLIKVIQSMRQEHYDNTKEVLKSIDSAVSSADSQKKELIQVFNNFSRHLIKEKPNKRKKS